MRILKIKITVCLQDTGEATHGQDDGIGMYSQYFQVLFHLTNPYFVPDNNYS